MTKLGGRRRASELIFEELALAILAGHSEPGSPLESERTLGVRFGASRSTVREAIHKLADASLVQVSQGAPTLVLDPTASVDPRVLALRYKLEGPREKRELAERRMLAGLSLVYLAGLRAPPEQIDVLAAAVEDYAARGAPPEGLSALDESIWTGLARLTENGIFAREVAWWYRAENAAQSPESDVPPAARVGFYRELLRRLRHRERAAGYYLDVLSVLLPA